MVTCGPARGSLADKAMETTGTHNKTYPANHQASTQTLEEKITDCDRLAGSEITLKRNRVFPLKCHGQLLKQITRLLWIASDVSGAFSNLLDQFDRLVVPGSRRSMATA